MLTTFGRLSDITNPSAVDVNGDPCLRVLKYGRITHWTAGQSNEIMSNCQRTHGVITKEWCIIDKNLGTGSFMVFSDKGDSGAMIFDFSGKIQGMLTSGGHPNRTGQGMTYAMPIKWLFGNIEVNMGGKVSL